MWNKVKDLIKLLPAITSLIGGNKKEREELDARITELERRMSALERDVDRL